MADGSLLFDTSLDSKGFKEGIAGLEGVAKKGLSVVAGLAVAAGTAMIGIATASVNVGMNFEASMSQVAATMGITVDEIANGSESFELLEQAAKDAGATTMFSASQSAEALNYLALAGYDAEKSVNALPTVLNLAAAGGLDLAYASDLVTDSMSALGMESDQLEGFVDQLAKTSQKSNTSVAQLGEAILTVGGTAKILAGGTTELNAQLGILADNGIKGSEGGTALRNVLLALSAPTEKQAEQMQKLGISAYDANGNLRPTNEIFQDLNSELSTMTQQERTEVLNNLFNKVDLKAANALLANSGERFDELSGYIDDADGAAAAMAETLNDNLKGKITILGSSLEGLGIQIYEGMEAPLKGAVDMAIDYVGQLSKAFEEDGFAGVMRAVGDIVAEVLVKIAAELPKLIDMGKDMILNFLNGIKENREALMESVVSILSSLLNAFFEIMPDLFELGVLLFQSLLKGIVEQLPMLIDGALNMIDTLIIVFIDSLPQIIDAGYKILMALYEGIASYLPQLAELAVMLLLTLAETILNNLPMIIETAVNIVETLLNGLTDKLPMILEMGLTMLMMLIDGVIDNVENLIDAAIEIIDALLDFIFDNLDMIIDFALQIVMALITGLINNLDRLIEASLELVDAIIEGLLDNLDLLIDAAIYLIIAVVEGLLNNLPKLVESGIKLVMGLVDGLIRAIPQLVASAGRLISEVIGAIMRLIPQLITTGLLLVAELILGILQAIPRLIGAAGTLVLSALKALGEGFKSTKDIGKNLVEGIWQGITGAGNWLSNKIKGFADGVVKGIKGFFGIKSPAQKTRKGVGDEIVHGVGAGIEDEMPDLEKDVKKEMEGLTKQMKATVEVESSGIGTSITSGTIGRFESENATRAEAAKAEGKYTIEVPVNIDGRMVAKTSAEFSSNELQKAKKRRK